MQDDRQRRRLSSSKLLSSALSIVAYAVYTWWRLGVLKRAVSRGSSAGPRWLALLLARSSALWSRLMGVTIKSIEGPGLEADPSRRYMYVWHPHGFVSYVPVMIMGTMAVAGEPHKREWFGTCAPFLFNLPVLGEHITLTNARPVDKRSLEDILASGATIAVQPGGVKEQAASRHDQEQALFPKRLGFIRLAIKYGVPLMPLYIFGENQLYRRVDGFDWLTRLIHKLTGMTLPIVRAKFGIPLSLTTPCATDVHVRYGAPVEVGAPEAEPSEERVNEVFERYVVELRRVWAENAASCLPPEVAANGLKISRL